MAAEDVLRVRWSKKENDFVVDFPKSVDGSFIHYKLFHRKLLFDFMKQSTGIKACFTEEEDFIKELERRGYDKTTLKFEIKLKKS